MVKISIIVYIGLIPSTNQKESNNEKIRKRLSSGAGALSKSKGRI
jgi:hypothetical protein